MILNFKKLFTKILQTLSTLLSWKTSATSEINSLSSWKDSATTSLSELSAWKTSTDTNLDELFDWKDSTDDNIDTLSTWKESTDDDIGELLDWKTSITSNIGDLSTDVSDMQTLIQTIQESITTTYITVPLDSGLPIPSNSACYLAKTGNTVRCYVGIGNNDGVTTIGSNVTLFTIPEGYRPSNGTKIFPAFAYNKNGYVFVANLRFNTDGTIIQSTSGAITAIYGSAEWQVN